MEKVYMPQKKTTVSTYLSRETIDKIDKWCAGKTKEIGVMYSRNNFIVNAVMDKLDALGLTDETQKQSFKKRGEQ